MGIVMAYGHFKDGYIPVDTHVNSISNRLGWVKTKNANETEQELYKIVPRKYWAELNDTFVAFGQSLCTSTSPWCSKCPIKSYCKRIGVTKNR